MGKRKHIYTAYEGWDDKGWNDVGHPTYTPKKAWDLVSHIFSRKHTVIIRDDGRVYKVKKRWDEDYDT